MKLFKKLLATTIVFSPFVIAFGVMIYLVGFLPILLISLVAGSILYIYIWALENAL